jgi:hypothetical protein
MSRRIVGLVPVQFRVPAVPWVWVTDEAISDSARPSMFFAAVLMSLVIARSDGREPLPRHRLVSDDRVLAPLLGRDLRQRPGREGGQRVLSTRGDNLDGTVGVDPLGALHLQRIRCSSPNGGSARTDPRTAA